MASVEQLRTIRIDREFETVCPPLSEDEAKQLEANILSDGEVTSPLIVWNGIMVDGHNRRKIILEHPELPFTIREIQFESRFDAIIWICKNQLGRRNLTEHLKAYLIGTQYETEKKALGASDGFRGNQHAKVVMGDNHPLPNKSTHVTRARIAQENEVTEDYVKRSGQFAKGINVAEDIIPGIKQDILSGAIKATKKEISAIAKAPVEQRKEMVEELQKPPKERRSVREKTVGIDSKYLTGSEAEEQDTTVNYDSIIEIIHDAAERMQGTCDNYLLEYWKIPFIAALSHMENLMLEIISTKREKKTMAK